jgi:hypothetical protein
VPWLGLILRRYLQLELARIRSEALKSLRHGKIVLPDSWSLPGLPDRTGSLKAGEICVVVHGKPLRRLSDDAAMEVLVYGSPGMNPGDLHKVKVVYPQRLLDTFEEHCDLHRCNAVFFSTLDERSLADRIAGGDYDGDEYAIIAWRPLVDLFLRPFPPYDANNPPVLPVASGGKPASSSRAPSSGKAAGKKVSAVALKQQVDERLLSNYLMARFMGSALVGTAGTQYMLCADKRAADGSAAHLDCLLLDHYYRMALDKLPPDVLTVEYMPRLPVSTQSLEPRIVVWC